MAAVRRVGAYAKLLANYAADDAVMAAGEAAELLFVRGLAFCSTSDSDGYITETQLQRYVGAGMRDAAKRARALVEHGLWLRVDGGYVVRSWTKLHETAEEKGRQRRTDRERKASERTVRVESERNPSGQPSDTVQDSATESLSLIQDSTQQDRTETEHHTTRSPRSELREIHRSFDEFWSVFPKKVAKVAAQRRFETLVKRGIDPAEIIAGAKAYRQSRHGEDPQFTKQPDGWLNAGRWQDEPPPAYHPPDGPGQATAKAQGWLDVGADPTRQEITTGGTP